MNNIIDIINTAVTALRTSFTIVSIVDNANGTYTIGISEANNKTLFSQLIEWEVITISNTVGFNADYKITNLNSTNKTFDIEKVAGEAIPVAFGTVSKNAPYFYPENIPRLNKYLERKSSVMPSQLMKFPLFYLNTDIDANNSELGQNIPSLVIYIINSVEHLKDALWRNSNTMPYLRQLEEDFFKKLNTSTCAQYSRPYQRREIFYGKKNENLNNSITDAIKIILNITF